ncbi:hypothetical protein HOE425_320409 [Hoeflea sp. EC-HK425]|nr:hypothetical protein HOE425_320409 [Hoeflea sp. EC-HK425]
MGQVGESEVYRRFSGHVYPHPTREHLLLFE